MPHSGMPRPTASRWQASTRPTRPWALSTRSWRWRAMAISSASCGTPITQPTCSAADLSARYGRRGRLLRFRRQTQLLHHAGTGEQHAVLAHFLDLDAGSDIVAGAVRPGRLAVDGDDGDTAPGGRVGHDADCAHAGDLGGRAGAEKPGERGDIGLPRARLEICRGQYDEPLRRSASRYELQSPFGQARDERKREN